MNVLLTCIGRRKNIVGYFKSALNGPGMVLAADSSPMAPGLKAADLACLVPPIDSPDYIEVLVALCKTHRVALLIPAMESELVLMDEHRSRFEKVGTKVLVSSRRVLLTCYDKLACAEFLAECGISTPQSYLSVPQVREALGKGWIEFPLVVKARWGASSLNCELARTNEELEAVFRTLEIRSGSTGNGEGILIQKCLKGNEYGLVIINDLDGNYVCTLVRRKARTRNGNEDWATTVSHRWLENIGRCIGENLGHIGTLDCHLLLSDEGCQVIDLDLGMGSGYPFSHMAGANFPAALLAWMDRRKPDPAWFRIRPNVTLACYDELEIVI